MRAFSEEIRLIITDCKGESSRKRFTVKVFNGSPFTGGYKLADEFIGGGSFLKERVESYRAMGSTVVCVNFKIREQYREIEVTPVGRGFAGVGVAVNLILPVTGSSRDWAGVALYVVKSGELVYMRREEVQKAEIAYREAGCAFTQNLLLRKKQDGTETLCRAQGASRRVIPLKPPKDFELDKIWNASSKDFTNFLECGK